MSTLVIIDLDGVVADSTERFARATVNGKIDWKTAFDPSLIRLDVPVPSALEAFKMYAGKPDTTVVFLTSRPEPMREGTASWLYRHGFIQGVFPLPELLMKPIEKQYTKTVVWKSEEVCSLSQGYDHTIFIDDEQPNRDAVKRLCPDVEVRASL